MDYFKRSLKSPSGIVSGLFSVFIILWFCIYPPEKIISWDNLGHYLYLPQTFIYNDISISDVSGLQELVSRYDLSPSLYQVHALENGNHVIQYPMGWAILNVPFFLVGHLIALILGYPADGFSYPYQISILIGYVFYSVLAIWLTRIWLRKFFPERLSAFLILILFLGTNLLSLVLFSSGISHIYQWVNVAFFMLLYLKWKENPVKWINLFGAGFFLGLITITRVTGFLVVFIPLLIELFPSGYGKPEWKNIFSKKLVLLVMAGFFLVVLFQMIYWYLTKGSLIYFSYANPGEGFDFHSPHVISFLFSFRKGWLIYSPVFIFFLFGLIVQYKREKAFSFSLGIFFFLSLFVLGSWSNWWFAASFGQRPLTEFYFLFLIPIGTIFIEKNRSRIFFLGLVIVFSALNLFQTWQFSKGIISEYRMTREYYWRSFGKLDKPLDADEWLLLDRLKAWELGPSKIAIEGHVQKSVFSSDYDEEVVYLDGLTYKGVYQIDSVNVYGKKFEKSFFQLSDREYFILKIQCNIMSMDDPNESKPTIFSTMLNKSGKAYGWQSEDLESNLEQRKWVQIEHWFLTPDIRSDLDKISVNLYLRGRGRLLVDNLIITLFEPKRKLTWR